jgi:hypothetical protein
MRYWRMKHITSILGCRANVCMNQLQMIIHIYLATLSFTLFVLHCPFFYPTCLQDENTRYIDIGPVNKVMNMLCCWFENPDSIEFKK